MVQGSGECLLRSAIIISILGCRYDHTRIFSPSQVSDSDGEVKTHLDKGRHPMCTSELQDTFLFGLLFGLPFILPSAS